MADRFSQAGDLLARLSGAAPEPKYIRAYHGSPHSFSRFDASKIGTGEGAQAYGHGLYFAGEENVARQYRNMLGGRRDVFIGDDSATGINETLREGPAFNTPRTPQGDAVRALMAGAYGVDSVDEVLQNARRYASDNTPEMSAAVNAALDELAARGLRLGPQPGHMYEVEIGYPEEALLDYDRPFATPGGIRGAAVLRQENPDILTEPMLRALRDGSWRFESYAGWQNAAEALARLPKTQSGAQALMDAGVPGVRYLDGQSRTAGEGTRNYVMFPGTEDSIRILRKYGLLAPVAASAAMEGQE